MFVQKIFLFKGSKGEEMSVYLNSIVKDRDDGKVFFSLKSIFLFEMKDILKDIIKYAIVFFKNTCGPLFT